MTLTASDLTGEQYHHTPADVDALHVLAEMLPLCPIVVNIGACFGTSTLAILEARPDAFVFSIDIAVCPQERENHMRALVPPGRCVRVLGASQDVGRYWPAHSVDFVFVDGAHDYEGVRDDIHFWMPTVKPGGIIAFHDYGTPSLPHVARAIDEAFSAPPLMAVERIRVWRL